VASANEITLAAQHLQFAVDAVPHPMVLINGEGEILLVNSETEKLFGYTPAELLGHPLDILVPEIAKTAGADFRSETFSNSTSIHNRRNLYARRKDGSQFPAEVAMSPVKTERETWALSSIIDITEQQRADKRFLLALEAAPNAMVTINNRGKIALVNSQAEEMFGYERDELLGERIEILVPESSRSSHLNFRNDYFNQPEARPMAVGRESRARRKDGSEFPVEVVLTPFDTAAGTWVLTSVVDLTFHRQKLESVGVLAAGIAHDFNNLLGSILAETELGLSAAGAGSSAVEELQNIRAVSIRASEIVRQLMIYAGQEKAHRELVEVSRLVQEMLELLHLSISKHAALRTNLGTNLPMVLGNASQIRQVVMNLILNASEALASKEGVITISTSAVTGGRELSPHSGAELSHGDYLRLEVTDTGKGMTEEEKAKIFDPFFTTKFAGRGLGLAVVQGIIRSHGGAINLVSEFGKGTTFQILLPCTKSAARRDQSVALPPWKHDFPGPSGTVLLVEDEHVLRRSVAKLLRKNGFTVIEAADGSTAIELFRTARANIDVILLDLTIPGLSSPEVIEEVRQIRSDIKVILTSAYDLDMVPLPVHVPQLAGFIRKPFHLNELVQLFRDVMAP